MTSPSSFKPRPCPKCNATSPCTSWLSEEFDSETVGLVFTCPTDGDFTFTLEGDAMFNSDPPTTPLGKALPRDDKTPTGG